MDHLERESRIDSKPARTCGPEATAAAGEIARDALEDLSGAEGGIPQEVADLIQRCLDGTEPCESTPYSNREKFSAKNVNMVMLRVAGFKVNEIAAACACTRINVYQILQHPYSKRISHALIMSRGARVLDIRTKLDQYADEILDQMIELTQESKDLEMVSKVGFGLLDRAGYNATQKVQQVPSQRGLASDSTLSRLASALEESELVNVSIMPAYIPKPPPDEGIVPSSSPGSDADLSGGGVRLTKVSNG